MKTRKAAEFVNLQGLATIRLNPVKNDPDKVRVTGTLPEGSNMAKQDSFLYLHKAAGPKKPALFSIRNLKYVGDYQDTPWCAEADLIELTIHKDGDFEAVIDKTHKLVLLLRYHIAMDWFSAQTDSSYRPKAGSVTFYKPLRANVKPYSGSLLDNNPSQAKLPFEAVENRPFAGSAEVKPAEVKLAEPLVSGNPNRLMKTTQLLRQLLAAEDKEWVGTSSRSELREVAARIRKEM